MEKIIPSKYKLQAFIAASMFFTLIIYLLYIKSRNVSLTGVLGVYGWKTLLLSFLFLSIAEVVRAIRLYVIILFMGKKATFLSTIAARIIGNTAGIITPGNLGAEPVRVLTLASWNGEKIESLAAAGVLESFLDALVLSIIALVAGLYFFPSSLIVILVSIAILFLWFAGLTGLIFREGIWKKIVKKVTNKMPSKLQEEAINRYKLFTKIVSETINLKMNIIGIFLTLLSLFFLSLSFLPLLGIELSSFNQKMNNLIILGAVAYSMSFVMSILPTPGGSGFFELGLDIVLPKNIVAAWRMLFILFSVVPTILLFIFAVKARRTIVENIKKSVIKSY